MKAIFTESGFVESTTTDEDIGIVLESTNFYAEQGGQVLLSVGSVLCIIKI